MVDGGRSLKGTGALDALSWRDDFIFRLHPYDAKVIVIQSSVPDPDHPQITGFQDPDPYYLSKSRRNFRKNLYLKTYFFQWGQIFSGKIRIRLFKK
jgi:hypothetical protein